MIIQCPERGSEYRGLRGVWSEGWWLEKTPQTSRGQLRQMFIASRVAKSLVVWVGAELVVDCLRKLSGAGPRGTCWGCGAGRAQNGEYRYCVRLPQLASIDRIGAFVSGQTDSLVLAIGEWGG